MWGLMLNAILGVINEMCPIKSYKVNERRESWITNEALEAIKDKDRVLKKARRTGKPEDWEEAKRLRNKVGRDLENLKADYLKGQQEVNRADPKKFWQEVSQIIPNNKSSSSEIWLRDQQNNQEVPPHSTAEFINKFFTEIGPNLAKSFNKEWVYFGDVVPDSIAPFQAGREEVLKLCNEINCMKSSGIDSLSSRICKDTLIALIDQLVFLFNSSLNTAKFPGQWKEAKVVPLFKGGNRENDGNYRPISLLLLPGKILEKIVHSKDTAFWEVTNFLSKEQGGFRKDHSTVATIADLTDDLFRNSNQGKTTVAAFIDLRKAFETVNLAILIKKLENSGIRGNVLKWCKNYLSNRGQHTIAKGKCSVRLEVSCGVPQGSVLGPLFFLVYVNDVQGALDPCNVKLYADDTILYQSGLNGKEAARKRQRSLNLFINWCSVNQLTLNTQKTKVMVFGSRHRVKKAGNVTIKADQVRLKVVPSYKYLGFTLDPTLNYNQHITALIRTVLRKLTLK